MNTQRNLRLKIRQKSRLAKCSVNALLGFLIEVPIEEGTFYTKRFKRNGN